MNVGLNRSIMNMKGLARSPPWLSEGAKYLPGPSWPAQCSLPGFHYKTRTGEQHNVFSERELYLLLTNNLTKQLKQLAEPTTGLYRQDNAHILDKNIFDVRNQRTQYYNGWNSEILEEDDLNTRNLHIHIVYLCRNLFDKNHMRVEL